MADRTPEWKLIYDTIEVLMYGLEIEAFLGGGVDISDKAYAALAAPLEAANKEIVALREAVRVLAVEVSQWHRLCIDAQAYDVSGRITVGRMSKMLRNIEVSSNSFGHAVRQTESNPIARAAIEAAKEEDQ